MPKPIPPPLGLTLTLLRAARSWSQNELAKAIGVSRKIICGYENVPDSTLDVHRVEQMALQMGYAREHVVLTLLYLGALLPVSPDLGRGLAAPTLEEHLRARRLATRLGLGEAQRIHLLLLDLAGRDAADAGGDVDGLSHLALKFLRVARGWTQAEVATAAGVPTSRVTRYETGESHLPLGEIEKIVLPMGYESGQVILTALYLRVLVPSPVDEPCQRARMLALRLGIIAARQLFSFLLDFARRRHLVEARREGGRQWQVLRGLKAAEQVAQIACIPVVHRWALVERLCNESVAAAARDAEESLHLATLALRVAEVAPGRPGWLRGYAWGFIGNAHRIRFHRDVAERDFATARRLWEEDPPAPDCPLGQWRILDLEASYRRDCRQFTVALDLLERALAVAPKVARAGILLNKGTIFDQIGDLPAALAVLAEAVPLVEESADASLKWTLGFNRASLLVQLGEFTEVEILMPLLRSLAARHQAPVRQTRLVWLDGRIAVGRGQRSVGRAAFEQARREFAASGLAADAALLSLEMAALDLEEGRVGEAASHASEVMAIFGSLRVERETLMGLRVFCEAALAHTATAQMARHLVENWGKLGGRGHGEERLKT